MFGIKAIIGWGIFIYVICLTVNTGPTIEATKNVAIQAKLAIVEVIDAK